MRTAQAREIRKGIQVAKADIVAASSPNPDTLGLTARIGLTRGILRTRLMKKAHAEYTRRMVLKINES